VTFNGVAVEAPTVFIITSGLVFKLAMSSLNRNIPACVEVPVSGPAIQEKFGVEGAARAPHVNVDMWVPIARDKSVVAGFAIVSHGGAVPVVMAWQFHPVPVTQPIAVLAVLQDVWDW
jgi:hypothetical protein